MFPQMAGPAFRALVEDIRRNGLREPILLDPEGRVIDGRSRLRACEVAEIAPRFETWDGRGSALALALSRNLHRAHLGESQRAMVGAAVRPLFEAEAQARMRAGKAPNPSADLQKGPVHAAGQAAELVNVSPRLVADAAIVLAEGDESLIAAARDGDIRVTPAARLARLPKERQRQILAQRRRRQAWGMAGPGQLAWQLPQQDRPPPGWRDAHARGALEASLATVARLCRDPDLDALGIDPVAAMRLQALAFEAMTGVERLAVALEGRIRRAAPREAAA